MNHASVATSLTPAPYYHAKLSYDRRLAVVRAVIALNLAAAVANTSLSDLEEDAPDPIAPSLKKRVFRGTSERFDYKQSVWWKAIRIPRSAIPHTRAGKKFQLRFSVPFPVYHTLFGWV